VEKYENLSNNVEDQLHMNNIFSKYKVKFLTLWWQIHQKLTLEK